MIPAFVRLVLLVLIILLTSAAEIITLDDSSFEHQTQASTGQTTSKWFVLFSVTASQDQVLDELALPSNHLAEEILVAKVNAAENENLALRFGLKFYPTFLFFVDQRVYEYKGPSTVEGINTFLESRYKTLDGSIVPPPLSRIKIWKRMARDVKSDWSRFSSNLLDDLTHIGQYRKNAAAALFLIGVLAGLIFGFAISRFLLTSKAEKLKKA